MIGQRCKLSVISMAGISMYRPDDPAVLRFEPILVGHGVDDEGQLVFDHDRLVALIVRLSSIHGLHQGRWFLEACFIPKAAKPPAAFFRIIGKGDAFGDPGIELGLVISKAVVRDI